MCYCTSHNKKTGVLVHCLKPGIEGGAEESDDLTILVAKPPENLADFTTQAGV